MVMAVTSAGVCIQHMRPLDFDNACFKAFQEAFSKNKITFLIERNQIVHEIIE